MRRGGEVMGKGVGSGLERSEERDKEVVGEGMEN